MRRIVVTPVTCVRHVELLAHHLAAQKEDFDEWHLWINTADEAELEAVKKLETTWTWIRTVSPEDSNPGAKNNLHRFYRLAEYHRADTSYLRISEDVAWMTPDFVRVMFGRRENPFPFLVHANVVGNPMLAYVHDRMGCVSGVARPQWSTDDDVACSPEFRRDLHSSFLASVMAGATDDWTFASWKLHDHEVVPLDVFAWLGQEFEQFEGRVSPDEEQFLCSTRPAVIGKHSVVEGRALCVSTDSPSFRTGYHALAPVLKHEPCHEPCSSSSSKPVSKKKTVVVPENPSTPVKVDVLESVPVVVAEPAAAQPVAEPAAAQPVAEPAAAQPVAEPAAAQPVAEPAAAQPVAKPTAAQPVAEPAAVEPVAEPAAAQPVAEPAADPEPETTPPPNNTPVVVPDAPKKKRAPRRSSTTVHVA